MAHKNGDLIKPQFAQEMLMLFHNNIIKNKKKSLDRIVRPKDRHFDRYPTIEINQPQVTQIDVPMMNSPDSNNQREATGYRVAEDDTL